ncbi:MAG: hydrogen peroxide-inducible genes activator, partial [Pseudomonadota bacterium]
MTFPAPPITLRQMRYLLALEEMRHFRHAAEACGISQPSLSVQIKALETSLGLELVERGANQVQLTVAGREVSRRARDILAATHDLMDLSVMMKSGLGGTVKLGTSMTIGPYLMPYVIDDLNTAHPDLKLYIREAPPRALLRELNDGVHDLIITQLPAPGASLVVDRLFREPLMVTMPARHPLAEKAEIEPSDLAGKTLLSLSPNYALHDQVLTVCLETGATLARDYEGTSLDALRQMVAMDMGLTLLPSLYIKSEITGKASDVVVRPLAGRRLLRSVGLVWRRSAGAS